MNVPSKLAFSVATVAKQCARWQCGTLVPHLWFIVSGVLVKFYGDLVVRNILSVGPPESPTVHVGVRTVKIVYQCTN